MAFRITEGKKRGVQAVADSRGVIAGLAIDQRSVLRKLFAQTMNTQAAKAPGEMLVDFKACVSRVLTPHASAILDALELAIEAGVKFSGVLCGGPRGKKGCRPSCRAARRPSKNGSKPTEWQTSKT
jgi:tagatose-1,6-bisphosphate aldolase